MSLKIVRNDITKMNTEAIVNTANEHVLVGPGCDYAVYEAAGRDELLQYRAEHIGEVPEGEAFITPGFGLQAKYIIHAVSPLYMGGDEQEEEKLRSCYRNSLQLAKENGIQSIAFPLISTGGFGYPKEEGMRIAVDEINAFLLTSEMDVTLVVFDEKATDLGSHIFPALETYIDQNYVEEKHAEEYLYPSFSESASIMASPSYKESFDYEEELNRPNSRRGLNSLFRRKKSEKDIERFESTFQMPAPQSMASMEDMPPQGFSDEFDAVLELEDKLNARLEHLTDTYSEYLLYLIQSKGMENAEVYKRAIVDKKTFSKIKNNPEYHPQKVTALRLCVGAKLNMDETRDLLARAGYALSPCDKMDIIFSFFIENKIYDMIELDIQLEEHGLPCAIS